MNSLDGNRLCAVTGSLRAGRSTGLAPYLTAGDGGLDRTLELLRAVERAGAACVELGVPFSDPIADGPTLQAAALRSLGAGTTLDGIEACVRAFRDGGGELPIIAFSYLNPLLSGGGGGGLGVRLASLRKAGFDGLLVPDLPVEEADGVSKLAHKNGLTTTLFCAPTSSDERLALAAAATRGFLYVVGRTGVTGANTDFSNVAAEYLDRVRRCAGDIPLGVGFGIRSRAQVDAVAQRAELAIVGSALVQSIHEAVTRAEEGSLDPVEAAAVEAHRFIQSIAPTPSS